MKRVLEKTPQFAPVQLSHDRTNSDRDGKWYSDTPDGKTTRDGHRANDPALTTRLLHGNTGAS